MKFTREQRIFMALKGLYPFEIRAFMQGKTEIGRKILKKREDYVVSNPTDTREWQIWEKQQKKGIWALTEEDPLFPSALLEIPSPPFILFGRGDPSILQQPCFSVVGTRRPSNYGEENALRFSEALARQGIVIVSGLAYGIDRMAHVGALRGQGRTVAVLGGGVDRVYPLRNAPLGEKIVQAGCLLSEYPPGMPAQAFHFLERNRLIAGLSRGVLIVEAGERSGTMSTASHAADQGKTVYAIPGNIDQPRSYGTNGLIREGASLVRCPEEILEDQFDVRLLAQKGENKVPSAATRLTGLGKDLYDRLCQSPEAPETLLASTGAEVADFWTQLTMLEMEGLVQRLKDGRYGMTANRLDLS